MALDRAGARRRVRTVTAWAACGAAALTAGAAFGAARGGHSAKTTARNSSQEAATQDALPQAPDPQAVDPYGAYPQDQQGFEPPSASTGPPQGMSGGS